MERGASREQREAGGGERVGRQRAEGSGWRGEMVDGGD